MANANINSDLEKDIQPGDMLLIQPRDICPSDYLTYLDQKLFDLDQSRREKAKNLQYLIDKGIKIQQLRHMAVEKLYAISTNLTQTNQISKSDAANFIENSKMIYTNVIDHYAQLTHEISLLSRNIGQAKVLTQNRQSRNQIIAKLIKGIQKYEEKSQDNTLFDKENLSQFKNLFKIDDQNNYERICESYRQGIEASLEENIKKPIFRTPYRIQQIQQKQLIDALERINLLNI